MYDLKNATEHLCKNNIQAKINSYDYTFYLFFKIPASFMINNNTLNMVIIAWLF